MGEKDLEKIRENALETLEVFVPLAEAIGAYKIKEELEDLSFSYLYSEEYQRLNDKLMILKEKTDPILAEMADNVTMCLNAENIDSSILSSYKNIYGVHIDLKNGKQLDGMHDLKALEVAVENSYGSCYLALGVIHQLYKPINHINDFLSNIKTNKYQAFHTTVFAPAENLVQARICTFDMANINTNGLMGFWNVHGDRTREIMQKDIVDKSPFFKSLREINRASRDDEDFVLQFREELLSGNIYVYTPTGEVIPLPIGATPIDFAYIVHTELGNKITEAYVNGQEVGLFHKLQTRDIVKVIVNEEAFGPTLDWLDNIKTSKARRKILEFKKK